MKCMIREAPYIVTKHDWRVSDCSIILLMTSTVSLAIQKKTILFSISGLIPAFFVFVSGSRKIRERQYNKCTQTVILLFKLWCELCQSVCVCVRATWKPPLSFSPKIEPRKPSLCLLFSIDRTVPQSDRLCMRVCVCVCVRACVCVCVCVRVCVCVCFAQLSAPAAYYFSGDLSAASVLTQNRQSGLHLRMNNEDSLLLSEFYHKVRGG